MCIFMQHFVLCIATILAKKYLPARNVRIVLPTMLDSDKMNIPIRK
mgnify:CR=1 FL=1